MAKDYYKILDITEFSTSEEIKSAYRKLARQWHPDIAGNTPDVLIKFKEINEAYEILSDNTRKYNYDSARKFYNYAKNSSNRESQFNNTNECIHAQQNETECKKHFSFNWELFMTKKTRDKEYKKNTPKKGEDIYSDIEISIFDSINGTTKIVNMLQTNICPQCHGRKFINSTQCKCCNGRGEISTYKKFNIKIPAGIKNKSKIRLAGEGEKGINGGQNGDLYLVIHINTPQDYKIDGLNILKTIHITPYDAVLGGEQEITTMKGNIIITISPQTRNGQKIRLARCGLQENGKIGDMIITLEIQTPTNLTEEELKLYKKLKEINLRKIK